MAGIQHPVPGPLLTQIGDITVSFALLELGIQSIVWSLIGGTQQVGQAITAEVPFRGLRALAMSLYRIRFGDDEDFRRLRELLVRAGRVEDRRNQVTHSIWGAGGTADTITRIKTTAKEKHGLQHQFESMTESDLAGIAGEIRGVAVDLQTWWLALINAGKLQ